eukprot:366341-Chlamydomonas_euryale.AAC.24
MHGCGGDHAPVPPIQPECLQVGQPGEARDGAVRLQQYEREPARHERHRQLTQQRQQRGQRLEGRPGHVVQPMRGFSARWGVEKRRGGQASREFRGQKKGGATLSNAVLSPMLTGMLAQCAEWCAGAVR